VPTTRRLVNHWDESYFLQLSLVILSLKATVRAKPGSKVIPQIVLEPPISVDFNNAIWDAQWDAHAKEDEKKDKQLKPVITSCQTV